VKRRGSPFPQGDAAATRARFGTRAASSRRPAVIAPLLDVECGLMLLDAPDAPAAPTLAVAPCVFCSSSARCPSSSSSLVCFASHLVSSGLVSRRSSFRLASPRVVIAAPRHRVGVSPVGHARPSRRVCRRLVSSRRRLASSCRVVSSSSRSSFASSSRALILVIFVVASRLPSRSSSRSSRRRHKSKSPERISSSSRLIWSSRRVSSRSRWSPSWTAELRYVASSFVTQEP
jgi:hypothetical protein